MTVEADVAVVGSGVSGMLVARAVLRTGGRVAVVERGSLKSHAEQLRSGEHASGAPGARPNHETAPGTAAYPWNYVYGVGGSTLHWTGATPRFSAEDFRMRSAYGVMEDWPFALEDLLHHYREAERVLGVAGAPGGALPPHPFSPADELVRELLDPYVPLPQARPTRTVGARPACCGSAVCHLCPVDSRFTVLNSLGGVLEHPRLELLADTAVERVVLDRTGRRAAALRCVRAGGGREEVVAPVVVLAAGGLENPAILLRSGIDRPDTGRHLFDHAHRTLWVRVGRDVSPGTGASLSTGATNRYRDGDWRSTAAAAYVTVHNPGVPLEDLVIDAVLADAPARTRYLEPWRHTLVLDVLLDDVPQAARRVSLSPRRDALGLPRPRIAYGPSSGYEDRGFARVRADVERALAPLGIRDVRALAGPAGSHLLGTCRIGGVVDGDLRHLDLENVYVTGGSAFPTYGPVHPTLTIAALALRLGEHLTAPGRG